jgi:hypothetical protein
VGVESAEPCAVVIGAGGVGLGPLTTSGVVVLGSRVCRGMFMAEERNATSARIGSSLGA